MTDTTDERVRYYENGFGKGIFFTDDGIYISMSGIDTGDGKRTRVCKITPLIQAREQDRGRGILEGRVNYFTGMIRRVAQGHTGICKTQV